MTVRGLNDNHNRDLKNPLQRSTALSASFTSWQYTLRDFYFGSGGEAGLRPTMARLTLARKIAAISLQHIWKKGVEFDPQQLHRQAASEHLSEEQAFPSLCGLLRW